MRHSTLRSFLTVLALFCGLLLSSCRPPNTPPKPIVRTNSAALAAGNNIVAGTERPILLDAPQPMLTVGHS